MTVSTTMVRSNTAERCDAGLAPIRRLATSASPSRCAATRVAGVHPSIVDVSAPVCKHRRTRGGDTVSRVSRRGWGGLVVRSLLVAVGASIVAVSTLVLWPLLPGRGPSADDRRIADLQRLTHAIEVYRVQHNVLPATLVKLPPVRPRRSTPSIRSLTGRTTTVRLAPSPTSCAPASTRPGPMNSVVSGGTTRAAIASRSRPARDRSGRRPPRPARLRRRPRSPIRPCRLRHRATTRYRTLTRLRRRHRPPHPQAVRSLHRLVHSGSRCRYPAVEVRPRQSAAATRLSAAQAAPCC